MDNLFELASRKQFRYSLNKGTINTEDLWELNLETLDKLARSLKKELAEAEEESFIKTRTVANKALDAKFEIVKHVIAVRLQEAEDKKNREAKAAKKARILEIIEKKEGEALESKSVEELTALLAD